MSTTEATVEANGEPDAGLQSTAVQVRFERLLRRYDGSASWRNREALRRARAAATVAPPDAIFVMVRRVPRKSRPSDTMRSMGLSLGGRIKINRTVVRPYADTEIGKILAAQDYVWAARLFGDPRPAETHFRDWVGRQMTSEVVTFTDGDTSGAVAHSHPGEYIRVERSHGTTSILWSSTDTAGAILRRLIDGGSMLDDDEPIVYSFESVASVEADTPPQDFEAPRGRALEIADKEHLCYLAARFAGFAFAWVRDAPWFPGEPAFNQVSLEYHGPQQQIDVATVTRTSTDGVRRLASEVLSPPVAE